MKMASRSIHLISKQKKIAHAAQSFFLLAKNQICTCSTLFCLSLPLFCGTTMPFCMTETSNFLVTDYFYGGIIPVFMFAFIFFHCRLFSPCWPLLIGRQPFSFSQGTADMKLSCFSSNEIRLTCFESLALALYLLST